MISYGWKSAGNVTAPAVAQTISPIAKTLESTQTVLCDGYSFIGIAIAHSNLSVAPAVDVYGSNFDTESAQTYKSVVSHKLAIISGNALGVEIEDGQFGLDYTGEWAAISAVTKVTSFGTGSMIGLMMSAAGMNGPEMSVTGTTPTSSFGSLDNDDYVAVAGSDSIPGFVVIPCGLFSTIQFSCSSPSSQTVTPLYCLFE
jgi:hypothetical protein